MNIAIIGAGPAGIISARNAIKAGHSVVLFEKNTRIGEIWNPWSGGAYRNACMQNSRYTFHYTGFPPGDIDEFLGVEQVFRYLSAVAGEDALRESIRLNTEVVSLRKDAGHRVIRCASEGKDTEDIFDRVIIATGELWQPRRPPLPGEENFSGTLITSRDYQEPEAFKGKKYPHHWRRCQRCGYCLRPCSLCQKRKSVRQKDGTLSAETIPDWPE
ncbi:FAD-dependent oxidoreductase [Escherichia coli]|nr:FAD-dependent oxidoreductase [Escherichia coli]